MEIDETSFLSQRPLSRIVRAHLRNYQTKIRELRISLYTDPGSPTLLPRIFCGLQRLDLYLDRSADIVFLFDNIKAVGANLERVSLKTANPDKTNSELDAWAMGETNDFTHYVPRLEEVRLSGFEFTNTFSHLSRIVNFHQLVRLELPRSVGGTHHFLCNLAWRAKGKRFRLKHIAADFSADLDDDEASDLQASIRLILQICKPIESFHISHPQADCSRVNLLNFFHELQISEHNLQSLSFRCEQFETAEWNEVASELVNCVSWSSTNRVKQLAVYFEESATLQFGGMTSYYSELLVSTNDYNLIQ
jgi:hypothetical protein